MSKMLFPQGPRPAAVPRRGLQEGTRVGMASVCPWAAGDLQDLKTIARFLIFTKKHEIRTRGWRTHIRRQPALCSSFLKNWGADRGF